MSVITKAVFPVAGLGTRFLPATKANPKEMLPIVDKPLIQYAVEEAISAGIKQMIFVTSSTKGSIEDHFDCNFELETRLEQRGKYQLLSDMRNLIPSDVSCVYIRQRNPLGLGHAVLCARGIVGDEPFAVLLADDLITSHSGLSCMQRMVKLFEETSSSVLAVNEVPVEDVSKYGIVALDPKDDKRITHIVEKPQPQDAPSRLAAVGRYVLTPAIFDLLANQPAGAGNEIQLTDAIERLLGQESAYIHPLVGVRYDCGSRLGYLKATIAYALQHPELGDRFRDYLSELNSDLKTDPQF